MRTFRGTEVRRQALDQISQLVKDFTFNHKTCTSIDCNADDKIDEDPALAAQNPEA